MENGVSHYEAHSLDGSNLNGGIQEGLLRVEPLAMTGGWQEELRRGP